MKCFGDLFMPQTSPEREIDPHENVLNQVGSLDNERHGAPAHLFMNQLHDAETGNIVSEQGDISAIGGEPTPPPPPVGAPARQDAANANIVNEYNSFNLTNMTPPIAPKWRTSETLLDDFCKFKQSCQRIFDGPMCHITSGKVKTSMLLIWAGPDGEDIMKFSTSCLTRSMTLTMCSGGLRSFVSQFAILIWQDLSFLKCPSTMVSLLMFSTTESSRLQDSVNFQTWMIELLMPLYLVPTV